MGHRPPTRGPSFGRDADRAEVRERLAAPGVVAVTGPPGIGKTRLVAEIADVWPEEVVWVDLEGATDEAPARVAATLGTAISAIGPALRSRGRALLVLDDAEGAALALPEWLAAWTSAAPDLRILASSRVRLDGAASWPLGPLDPGAAAALYVNRASAVQPGLDLDPAAVAGLVDALDRLPLALELAAARVRLFPPETLTRRLPGVLADRRRSGRHGSLDAALAVSWELLGEDQRRGLAAATVLHGPFDAAAFEQVTACDAEILEALLDASLLAPAGAGRVRLLETVRAFAAGRMGADPELEVRHTRWALETGRSAALVARADGDWTAVQALRADLREVVSRGGDDAVHAALVLGDLALAAGPRVDPTRGLGPIPDGLRVRVACLRANFLLDAGRHEEALALLADAGPPSDATERLLVAQHRMIHLRHLNRPDEALAALAEADRAAPDADPFHVASLRIAEAVLHTWRSEPDRAIAALEAGRRAIDAPALDARLRAYLGGVLSQRGDARVLGVTHLEHALASFRQLGDLGWQGVVRVWLGGALFDLGRLDAAAEHLQEAAVACARCGDVRFGSQALEHLAGVRIEQRRWEEVADLHARIRASPPRASILALLRAQEGLVAHFAGRTADARAHYEAAVAGFEAQGHRKLSGTYQLLRALVDPTEGLVDRAESTVAGLEEHFPLLVRITREALGGGLGDDTLAEARRVARADVRILLALTDRGARVALDGGWFEPRGGARVGLEKRPVLQRALAALAAAGPGTLIRRDALIAAAWPGERMTAPSADARLHATIRALRRLGLEPVLCTGQVDGDLGYGLTADVQVLR